MFLRSSSSSSSFSSSPTKSIIEQLNEKKIVSCVLAMCKIKMNNLSKNFAHASLLLINTDSETDDKYRGTGIVIEYGDYSPKMSEEEKEDVEKGIVIYRYGDKGGIRYYAIDYKEYLRIFGDICYVSMDIESYNQITFQYFIDSVAPTSENIWIKEKYKASILNGIIGKDNHNCQSFAVKALNILKPKFISSNIVVNDKSRRTKKKIDVFPSTIKEVLETLKI